jgi:hypothetical protein
LAKVAERKAALPGDPIEASTPPVFWPVNIRETCQPTFVKLMAWLAEVSPVEEKVSVYSPTSPSSRRFVNVAVDDPLRLRVVVPANTAEFEPELEIEATTSPVKELTGFPSASRTTTTGWVKKSFRLTAEVAWVVITIWVAVPVDTETDWVTWVKVDDE